MKTPKELDVLRRKVWFEDTPDLVEELKGLGLPQYAKHLHRMHVYHKSLIAEIRKLRKEIKNGQT
jgi:hypothetical protein